MSAHDHAATGPTRAHGRTRSMDGWREELLMELRLRDVPGTRIGDVLAEVEAHCAESGEPPADAFGDPRAYAATVAPADGARSSLADAAGGAARGLGSAAAALLLFNGIAGLRSGEAAQLSAGMLAVLGVTLVVAAFVVRRLDLVLRHPVWLAGVMAVVTTAGALPALLWRGAAVTLPAWVAVVAGVVLLIACWWRMVVDRDPVVDPRTGAEAFATSRVVPWLLWGLPALLLVIGVAVTLL